MKGARTIVNADAHENLNSDDSAETVVCTPSTPTCDAEDLVDTVEQLRENLRRKNEKLLQMDVDLRFAQVSFAELEVCSREVEQELENEVSRLSRLNRELENANKNLKRSLRNVLGRVYSSQMETTSVLDDKVANLQKQLRSLEQENDDLQMLVRRLEASNEDLSSELERCQEKLSLRNRNSRW